jgi:hypothetical protein
MSGRDLRDGRRHVERVGVGHALHRDGRAVTDRHVADHQPTRATALGSGMETHR